MLSRAFTALVALVLLPLLSGCDQHVATTTLLVRSPSCLCRFTYSSSWWFQAANGDTSVPALGLHSYDISSADHRPVPHSYADIGISWHADPTGQLFDAAARSRGDSRGKTTVSGFPALSFMRWTTNAGPGRTFEQHVYVYVPRLQRDYDFSLFAGNPPSNDVRTWRSAFARFLSSVTIVPSAGNL